MALGLAAVLVLGAVLCARPAVSSVAEPALAVGREARLAAAAREAQSALDQLIASLQAAVDAGRRGTALVIQGDDPPQPQLRAAATAASAAIQGVAAVQRAVVALEGIRDGVAPGEDLPGGVGLAAVVGTDSQLERAADAAGPFVMRRAAAHDTLAALGSALAALDAGRPGAALGDLDRAADARRLVAAWPAPPTVLPFWLSTTRAMLRAAHDIAQAAIDKDQEAADRAGRAYARAARDARRADTALALAISETGASLAATPLTRLAAALRDAEQQRMAVASVLALAGR